MKNDRKFRPLYLQMIQQAKAAVSACTPVPMVVGEADGFSNRFKPGATLHYVSDGVCGFAWVKFAGNSAFGRWAKEQGYARPDYPSGLSISAYTMAPEIRQSLEKGEAAARAAAKVLNEAGIQALAQSRID